MPEFYSDIEEAIFALLDEQKEDYAAGDHDFVENCYGYGKLRAGLSEREKNELARLLKKSGYVPSKRIFLDAQADKDAIYRYLADSDRFNIKQVWSKKKSAAYRQLNPIGILDEISALFNVATAENSPGDNPGSPIGPDSGGSGTLGGPGNPAGSTPLSAPTPSTNPVKDSPSVPLGGMDFRLIKTVTQPMGNFSGLNFSLPKLSNVENINLSKELDSLQKMLKAGITPSADRFLEYVTACYQKGEVKKHLDGIVGILVDTCKLVEEKVEEAPIGLKKVMLILDAVN